MQDEVALLDLIQRVQPNAECTRRWIALLELHLDALRSCETRSTTSSSTPPILERGTTSSTEPSAEHAAGSSPNSARQRPAPLVCGKLLGKPQLLAGAVDHAGEAGADVAAGPGSRSQQASPNPAEGLPSQHLLSHRLPTHVVWAITLLIPVQVAIANNLMVWSYGLLLGWKFGAVQALTTHVGIGAGAPALAAICVGFCAVAAGLVAVVAPVCAGSGLPEAKGFLNGNRIRGIFKVRVLPVRVVGIILALAAGFPIGREGPMVAIGGTLGYGVAHFVALPWARHWVQMSSNTKESSTPALVVDEERFAHVKRVGFILGGAAGIATAFDAPIGGILYMFEEATMTTWPPELTFRVFVCSVCGALISKALFNLAGQDVHRLLIYVEAREEGGSWDWIDVPFFALLAACLGLLSALFTRVIVSVWGLRQRLTRSMQRWQPQARIAECMFYCLFCALAFALVPLLVSCVEVPTPGPPHSIKAAGGSLLEQQKEDLSRLVRHTCPEGSYNRVATVFFKGAEGTVKHLLSRDMGTTDPASLALALGVYAALAAGMAGLPVPMGNFLPSMLIGALGGRIMGEAIRTKSLSKHLHMPFADAGVYAMVGSAAMLSGFTHMTIAVVVILVEAAHDLTLVSPLMLSIFISYVVSKCVNRLSYDEALILRKGVPFLEAELPWDMDRHGIVAADLCETLPSEVLLPREASVAVVQRALMKWEVAHFPVVAEGVCVGLIPRARLEAAMRARGAYLPKETAPVKVLEDPDEAALQTVSEEEDALNLNNLLCSPHGTRSALELDMEASAPSEEAMLPVHCIMDPSPYTLLEDMPAPRLYPLFTRTGTSAACVVSRRGEFRGLLSRVNLISAANNALRPTESRRYSRLG